MTTTRVTYDPMNERKLPTDTDQSVDPIFVRMFSAMMSTADARESRWRADLATAPALGPCGQCGRPGQALDEAASLQESAERNERRLVYTVCDLCEAERHTVEVLAGYGVPHRVRHATFANYETPDPKQAAALERVRAWAADPAQVFLLLLGTCGTGKGHFAAAALRELRRQAIWTSHAAFIDGYLAAGLEHQPGYLGRHQRMRVLVLDEMGAKGMTPATPEIFYKLLERRYDQRLKTILIGNIPKIARTAGRIDLLSLTGGPRIASRLNSTESTEIRCKWTDYRTNR